MRILDGPLGTRLLAKGVPTPVPIWSAAALTSHPEVVAEIHHEYATAGATIHTANTFRTKRRNTPQWAALATLAVDIARASVPPGHRVAGSIAPLADCYRPDLSPPDPRPEHRELARHLAPQVDLLLCETFPHPGEALIAVEEAVATGVETWVAFTAGPEADLLSPAQVRDAARDAIQRGASAVLVNCIPASRTLPYVRAIAGLGVPFGAYANAGHVDERMGWTPAPKAPQRYLSHATAWIDAGATLIGACCGTGPEHIAALAAAFSSPRSP